MGCSHAFDELPHRSKSGKFTVVGYKCRLCKYIKYTNQIIPLPPKIKPNAIFDEFNM